MIKLKKLLEGRSEQLEFSEVRKILQTNNPQGSFPPMYRGVNNNSDYLFIKPTDFTRVSANTKNYYTILLDNLPSWKQYPKRSNSIICTTYNRVAKYYGNVYRVVPKDGSKIAICPESDIWDAFRINLSAFNKIIDHYIQKYNMTTNNNITGNSYNELLTLFKYMQEIPDPEDNDYDEMYRLIYSWKSDGKNMELIDYIDTNLLNPVKNGFRLVTYPKYTVSSMYANEIWTDGDSILINDRYSDDILGKS